MTKNTAKIKAGIRALSLKPNEIISGTVVPGSLDSGACTVSVLPSDGSGAIGGVMLNAVAGDENGFILFPEDGSNVIIGSVDGTGEWTLIKASDISKAVITIGNVTYEMDSNQVNIQNGSLVFNIGTGAFKMNTEGESLFQLLSDLMSAITTITYTNGSGAAALTPASLPTITNLQTRLGNLLSA
jgi:hypothetical protein